MIGLDTKVIVRYIMQDDPTQSPKATRLVERLTRDQPGFVSRVAVVEVVWVLSASDRLRSQGDGHDTRGLNIRKQPVHDTVSSPHPRSRRPHRK